MMKKRVGPGTSYRIVLKAKRKSGGVFLMSRFFHDTILGKSGPMGQRTALVAGKQALSYEELAGQVQALGAGLASAAVKRNDRVAVFLDKRIETVVSFYGTSLAGGIFVPCNPVLKPPQVAHILGDCTATVLISSKSRIEGLSDYLKKASSLRLLVSVDGLPDDIESCLPYGAVACLWQDIVTAEKILPAGPACDSDVAAIFYTSGSTGRPKGVVLSHRNLVVGGESVAEYLGNHADDRILSLLPLSFDAGFSQLTTGFHAGATVILHNYLLPRDVPRICARHKITGLTCVPPLWIQLLQADWPDEACKHMRYFANTGGRMPRDVLSRLRALYPHAEPFLMYGLTEAFRSTYLNPKEVDRRPDSIGKAIPNAEILVVKPDGSLAGPGEEGELVHRGPLVALGYWNDAERTAERYKPAPNALTGVMVPEPAVWSGDMVRMDEDGFLYFVGRTDDMIKTSGYRVSPVEVEEALFDTGLVSEAAAFGLPHDILGQEIVVAIVPTDKDGFDEADLLVACRKVLPGYMIPAKVILWDGHLPRSPNGKIDRKTMAATLLQGTEKSI